MNQMWTVREISNDFKVFQLQQAKRTELLFTKIGRQKSYSRKLESSILDTLSLRRQLSL